MAESSLLPHLMVTSLNSPLPSPQGHLQLDKQSIFLTVAIVLSFVLLVVTLVLYAHWVCRYRHSPYPPSSSPTSSPGVDPVVLGSLPIIVMTAAADHGGVLGSECAICLGLFVEGEEVKVLPGCTHAYHSECVDTWLATRSSCPLCRSPLIDQLHRLSQLKLVPS